MARLYGTAWCSDPAEDMTTILMIQHAHAGFHRTVRDSAPRPPPSAESSSVRLPIHLDFWTAAYQAIDD